MQLFLCGYGFSVIWLESIFRQFFCYVPTHFVKYASRTSVNVSLINTSVPQYLHPAN